MDEEEKDIAEATEKPKKKSSLLKRITKIFLYIILAIVSLNVLLYVLLSIPAVQQKAKDFAVSELKEILKTEISIDELRLNLFNKISLKGIYIEDQSHDTLLYANNLEARVDIWRLLNSELLITGIDLDDFAININQKDSISDFNFQFIIDAFASTDSTQTDTTKSVLRIVIKDLSLNNGRLNYDVKSAPRTPGIFNASHISISELNGNIDLNSIDSDDLDIVLNNLTAKEHSGLTISNLQGHLYSSKSQLWLDGLSLTMPNSHLRTKVAKYNLDSNEFEINTQDTEIEPHDLTAFIPSLRFMTNKIGLQANIKGKLPFVDIQDLLLSYGEDMQLNANAEMSDVYKYGDSEINLFIDKFKISPKAITEFARVGDSTFVAPDILRNLGDVQMKGSLTGKLSKFKLNIEAWSKQGIIILGAGGKVDTTFNNFNVNARLQTRNFGLGRLLGTETGLGKLSMSANITAMQSERVPLSAKLDGKIDVVQYNKQDIKRVSFDGFYNAQNMGISIGTDWKIGNVFANVEMTQTKIPDIHFDLAVDTIQLDMFYKNEAWKDPKLSFRLRGDMQGMDIDNLSLNAELDSLNLSDSVFQFQPGLITFDAGIHEDKNKFISLRSSLLSFDIDGQYKFTTIADEFTELMHTYMPDIFQIKKHIKNRHNNFTFNLKASNTEEVGKIFSLPFDLIENSSLQGRIDLVDKIVDIKGDLPHTRFGEFNIRNTELDIVNRDSSFNISGTSNILRGNDLYKTLLDIGGRSDELKGLVKVNSDSASINVNGQIEALAHFDRDKDNILISSLNIVPSTIRIANIDLNLMPAEIFNKGDYTRIQNFGIGVNGKKYLDVDGIISPQETDSLRIHFNHAEIGDILKPLNVNNIEACVHGSILATNILKQPELYTKDFEIADIILFNDTLGTLSLESQWSDDIGGVRLDANLMNKNRMTALIDGFVYPTKNTLDLSVMFNKMPLEWMQPFVSDLLYKTSGSISSGLSIEGSMNAPKTEGWFKFNNAEIGINYTNVSYQISDTIIEISPDKVGFEGLIIKDQYNNKATIKGSVTHHNFDDMKYALDMDINNLMVLNTEDRTDSLFYGKLFASGNVKMRGDNNGINLDLNIRNDKNSRLKVQIPQTEEASDYKSIVYINVPEEKKAIDLKSLMEAARRDEEDPLNMKLNMTLNVNPGIALGVVINPSTGDNMQVKGNGQIKFGYDLLSEAMSAYGDYTLTEGNVKVNLQHISNLEFRIREGSKLTFVGDPLKTQFNITAYRRVKANLNSLDNGFSTGEGSARVNVDCVLGITGNMDKMTLTYNIELPDAPDDIKRRVNSLIATDEQKIKQFAYLVVSGSFFSNTGSGGSLSNSLWTNLASSTISGALNSVFGNILGDQWEIGTNIESTDGTLNDVNMSVNVSRKFLDDKLKINTNLGYQSDQTMNDNSIIGDFEVEYQLTPTWTIKAYNHTNDKYYRQAATTQGIGLVYTREARVLKRLFNFLSSGRRKRSNREQVPQATSEKQPIINEEKK